MSDTASASAVVDASPDEVFDFIRRPANHAEISGDGSVKAKRHGPDVLNAGDKFGVAMKLGVPYRISSTVVEFEENRCIAWAHPGKHRWRWEVEPTDDGKARVTETFDLSTAVFPPLLRLMGYPRRHQANLDASVANVVAHFSS